MAMNVGQSSNIVYSNSSFHKVQLQKGSEMERLKRLESPQSSQLHNLGELRSDDKLKLTRAPNS